MSGLQRQRNLPQIAFVDEDLSKELEKINTDKTVKEIFPEHEFIGSCLRVGLTISDLEKLTYIDVMKILLTFINNNKETTNQRIATQRDIDKLLG